MKTIQAVARYFPENCGGIQIHLSEILPALKALGVESQIVASQDGLEENFYEYRGAEVYRYPVSSPPKAEPNDGRYPHGGFDQFATWLKEHKADVYHQHQWTPKCGLPHLRLAKNLGMATVVSVHLPQPICQRQTLMLNGSEACDGKIDPVRCSYCCGVPSNLPPAMLNAISQMPVRAGVLAGGLRRLSKLPTPIRTVLDNILATASIPTYVSARRQGLMEMAQFADRIVAMSQWVYQALRVNGIPEEKLFLLKHGISDSFAVMASDAKAATSQKQNKRLRIGFLGRWDRNKGIHILIEAVKQLPIDTPLELIIHGVTQDENYRKQVTSSVGNDPRIQIAKQLKREELASALSGFDVLAVPSQWLEIGPMVVLEAHGCGIPVVGSNLGGVAEKIKHGVDGLLVPASDVKAWAEAFNRLATDRVFLNNLREGIRPVRTISMEAEDSVTLYETCFSSKS